MKLSLAINAAQINLDSEKLKKIKINLNNSKTIHRWVPSDLLHITLLSLGETENEKIKELDIKIKSIIHSHGTFELKLNGVSAYPNLMDGRLLWIGVQNSIPLRELQNELARSLISENVFNEDKIFQPILPIVRLKNFKNVSDMVSPYKNTDFGKLKVEQLVLYDMIVGGAFPIYKLIKAYPINPNHKKNQPAFIAG
ncbi:MAG: RNA 2',3'-cyclic phosphodiesterase [Bacteriovorax sp.]|nr:RNA 2',3'-cyclic phosphodiesterase [Bacteriovorax sp.]